MNKRITAAVSLACLVAVGASASISIESTAGGSLASTIDMNVFIGGTGAASTGSPWFSVSGGTTESGAFDGAIGVTIDAMKNVSLAAGTLGDKLTDGGIDRDAAGFIGVTDNPNGGGIGADASNHEGLAFNIDEITGLDPSLSIQITGINVQNIGRAGTDAADESFTIVNLITRDSFTYTPLTDGITAGTIDVSGLNLIATAGSMNPVAAIFSGDVGGFRVDGLTIEVIPEPETLGMVAVSGLGLIAVRRFFAM
ncbi:MAG: hypothetical protein JXR25_11460 [Pontiellaceae bacterium]|nr:hypothetical protein [Pontiellaceae bacterium]MBN2785431.1 hypothetical protein [Pontiellaceae bacterium]